MQCLHFTAVWHTVGGPPHYKVPEHILGITTCNVCPYYSQQRCNTLDNSGSCLTTTQPQVKTLPDFINQTWGTWVLLEPVGRETPAKVVKASQRDHQRMATSSLGHLFHMLHQRHCSQRKSSWQMFSLACTWNQNIWINGRVRVSFLSPASKMSWRT